MPRFVVRLLCIKALKSASKYDIESPQAGLKVIVCMEKFCKKPCLTLLLLFHFRLPDCQPALPASLPRTLFPCCYLRGMWCCCDIHDLTWCVTCHAKYSMSPLYPGHSGILQDDLIGLPQCLYCILEYPDMIHQNAPDEIYFQCMLYLRTVWGFPEMILSGCPHCSFHVRNLFKDIVSVPEMFATSREIVKLWRFYVWIFMMEIMMGKSTYFL